MTDYLDEIVAFTCQSRLDQIPPDIIQRANLVIADSLAVIARGAQEGKVKTLIQRFAIPNDNYFSITMDDQAFDFDNLYLMAYENEITLLTQIMI